MKWSAIIENNLICLPFLNHYYHAAVKCQYPRMRRSLITHTTLSSMESMRDDYEWTAMIILMKMAMRMDWISLDVEPTWPSIQRVQAHLYPPPAVWPNAKQNDDGLVFLFGRNLRAYFCWANSILTCSTSSILLHQANTNSSSCFG